MRDLRPVLALGLVLGAALVVPATPAPQTTRWTAGSRSPWRCTSDVSPALRDIAKPFRVTPGRIVPRLGNRSLEVGDQLPDPVQQTSATIAARAKVVHNYTGLGVGFPGYNPNAIPPDTVGAVGGRQYVQWVNSRFLVIDKETGKPAARSEQRQQDLGRLRRRVRERERRRPGRQLRPLRRPLGAAAVRHHQGNYECVAMSKTDDATGPYNRYEFKYVGFNDYPKAGVWSHSYVETYNMFDAERGTKVCAWDRIAMLAGKAAKQNCFNLTGSNAPALLPADADGTRAPGMTQDVPLMGLTTSREPVRCCLLRCTSTGRTRASLSCLRAQLQDR